MPKRTDIGSLLVLGAGPIVIGQAGSVEPGRGVDVDVSPHRDVINGKQAVDAMRQQRGGTWSCRRSSSSINASRP